MALSVSCGDGGREGGGQPDEDIPVAGKTIEEVQAAHADSLMGIPGVVGTAIGMCDSTPCIRVFLSRPDATAQGRIPDRIDGYPVRVEVTGEIRPLGPGD